MNELFDCIRQRWLLMNLGADEKMVEGRTWAVGVEIAVG